MADYNKCGLLKISVVNSRKNCLLVCCLCVVMSLSAQFHPPVGWAGTSAIHKDSSVFVNWASSCQIIRGYQDISSPLAFASVGDSTSALGAAGDNNIVSLGDAGEAILQFPFPISDADGYDFAVFENSFSDDYLELAFVEVSSDGENFVRFPATSHTQDTLQLGPFDLLDATKINNLAGKYRMYYGTPFDLQELIGISSLDIHHITHVKIIDVTGSLLNNYASFDQLGNTINDPWPTPFASSGFDLDAVGIIHQQNEVGISEVDKKTLFNTHQNENILQLFYHNFLPGTWTWQLHSISGFTHAMGTFFVEKTGLGKTEWSVENLSPGIYLLEVGTENQKSFFQKVLIR